MTYRLLALALLFRVVLRAQTAGRFDVEETTIGQVHDAMRERRLTCRELVDAYIRRINAYDKNGPAINAIVTINPDATKEADEMDRRFGQSGLTGPLHCVPMIVRDNFETKGLQTSNGALAFAGYRPIEDASQVARVKAAGAIVLAKSNMAEWAFSPVETVSSILPGYTKNPYVLDRVTAGSSGGTAAAIAANFGLVGFGSDTGDSIRGPSSHQSLAGIRSTMGLTSRAGLFPLNTRADIAGPMARTMEDAVKVFQVIVGRIRGMRPQQSQRDTQSPIMGSRSTGTASKERSSACCTRRMSGTQLIQRLSGSSQSRWRTCGEQVQPWSIRQRWKDWKESNGRLSPARAWDLSTI
jgi:amidase